MNDKEIVDLLKVTQGVNYILIGTGELPWIRFYDKRRSWAGGMVYQRRMFDRDQYNRTLTAIEAITSLDPTWVYLNSCWYRLSAFETIFTMLVEFRRYSCVLSINNDIGASFVVLRSDDEENKIHLQSTLSKYFEYDQLPRLKLKN